MLAGQQRLSGLLSSCTSGLLALHTPVPGPGQGPLQGQLASPGTGHLPGHLAGQGHLPGPSQGPSALEGFQGLDSAAKIALLQRLTAAKAGPADKEWAKVLRHLSCSLHTVRICTRSHAMEPSRKAMKGLCHHLSWLACATQASFITPGCAHLFVLAGT